MRVVISQAAKVGLSTLSPREQLRVQGLFSALENWDNDPHIQNIAHPLTYRDTYYVSTSGGIRIFFNKHSNRIFVLDIASKKTVDQFADAE